MIGGKRHYYSPCCKDRSFHVEWLLHNNVQVRQVAYELCLSVSFLHAVSSLKCSLISNFVEPFCSFHGNCLFQHRLTHTDLKPENVLFYDRWIIWKTFMKFVTKISRASRFLNPTLTQRLCERLPSRISQKGG